MYKRPKARTQVLHLFEIASMQLGMQAVSLGCFCVLLLLLLVFLQVLVEHGTEVRAGDDLVIIEAMKVSERVGEAHTHTQRC
jgi:hypothetical protein